MQAHDPRGAAGDTALLIEAARQAGALILARMKSGYRSWQKPATHSSWGRKDPTPVTEADLEADQFLKRFLTQARPDYGWLSEETPDNPERLRRAAVFIVDPIDGTRAFIKGSPEFTVALAVALHGAPQSGVIFNPMTGEMFSATKGEGALLNGQAIAASARETLDDALLFGGKDMYTDKRWPRPWPALRHTASASFCYRLAKIAQGAADGLLSLSSKHEWDVAAGALLIAEAGGSVTTRQGSALVFNQPEALQPSLVAGGQAMHRAILERVKDLVLPPEGR